jgi:hypothetical protein
MKSFNIIVLGLLTIIGLETTKGQGLTVKSPPFHGGSPPMGLITSIDLQLSIPSLPKVGEVFEVTFTVKCKNDLEGSHFGPDYKVYFTSNSASIATGKEQHFTGYLKRDEIKQFKATMVINKAVPTVSINSVIEGGGRSGQSIGFVIFLIDKQTGQYGTKEEYEGKLPIEYRYDPVAGSFTCSPSQNPAPVEENRRIIKLIKQLEPALRDSEALYLHSDMYRVGIPKGAAQWDETNKLWNDSGIFKYYLKDGWLKAFREGKIEQWREKEKKKIENESKEGSFNFFRLNNDRGGNDYTACLDTFYKTCDGVWKFKDHLYNKDQGLLAQADKKGIKQGRARVLTPYVSGDLG